MHRLPALLLIPLITVAAVPASASAQTLSEIRDQVREPTKAPRSSVVSVGSPASKKRPSRGGHRFSCDDDDSLEQFVGEARGAVVVAAASTPFVVPRAALNDDGARGYFPDYPYDANAGSQLDG